jgi:hypothetical protein
VLVVDFLPVGVGMTIRQLLQNKPFGPEEISVLVAAYEATLKKLGLVERDDPLTQLAAKKISNSVSVACATQSNSPSLRCSKWEWVERSADSVKRLTAVSVLDTVDVHGYK